MSDKPTIVFVHGAWSDASTFNHILQILNDENYPATSFANPLRSLSSDTARLVSFLQTRTEGPVLLVGHSYGGALITGAASSHPDVKGLVYLNGFVPDEGETILGLSSRAAHVDADALFEQAPLPGGHDVDLYLMKDGFAGGFSNGLSKTQIDNYFASQRPITFRALSESAPSNPAWKTLRSWYVAGTHVRIIALETQLFMATRAGSTLVRLRAGYLAMVSQSPIVVSIIKSAATTPRQ